ncbi:MAG: protein translocase subunit SecF [Chloroflexi bacterium]|nr:protein translocase subunit SecF [Chloroflexota bacterium]
MLDLVGRRYWFFLLSALFIVPGLISLAIPPGLKAGIDFSSGSTMTIAFEAQVTQADLRSEFADLGHGDTVIQRTGEGNYLVRTRDLSPDAKGRVEDGLRAKFGAFTVLDFYSVSPVVATEIVQNSALAVVVASFGILMYLWWAFRQVPNPFRYGVCAVVALIHDVLVVLGAFSIMGKLFEVEIDAMFITGLLTVIGFSVHDTIVVFDRTRENLKKGISREFDTTVNASLLETMSRSVNTSLTVVITLAALLLFGGVTIRNFLLVLLIGIISGTYSSIFNASQLLVAWEKGDFGRFFRRLQPRQAEAKRA